MSSATLLALDFGGTKLSAAVLAWPLSREQPCSWQALERLPSPANPDRHSDLAIITTAARRVLGGQTPRVIGVSFGGPVDHQHGVVRLSHHVPAWQDFPLAAFLQAEFGAPAVIDNDANLAALGEYSFGAGQGAHSLLYLTVSTGVGGGWILEGKIWRGVDGMAGEIGHTLADPTGPQCSCGEYGCVERLASGLFMAQDARLGLQADPGCAPLLRDLVGGDLSLVSGQTISQAAAQGDPYSLSLLQRSGRAAGVGISNACNLLNPERVVVGGGISKAGDLFWEPLLDAARRLTLAQIRLDVRPATLGDDSPLWGAVVLASEVL